MSRFTVGLMLSVLLSGMTTARGQAQEACCLPGGGCQDLPAAQCATQGGTPQGYGTQCAMGECQACCYERQNLHGRWILVCEDRFVEACMLLRNSVPQGPGTTCAAGPCLEACCLPDSACQDLPSDDCLALDGAAQGWGSSCSAGTCEACCRDYGCAYHFPEKCLANGGTPQGLGSSCDTVDCTIQACCFSNGSPCEDLPESDCWLQGGTPQGLGRWCGTDGCQACCLSETSCEYRVPDYCMAEGGFPQGVGSSCGVVDCSIQACCFSDGSPCQDLWESDCTFLGGTPQGFGRLCGTHGCQACCVGGDGYCEDMVPDRCLAEYAGAPQGLGSQCASGVCATGACCDPMNGACTVVPPEDCLGYYQGDGTECPLDGMCQACCYGGVEYPSCMDAVPEECLRLGGAMQGPGTTCLVAGCVGACCFADSRPCQELDVSECSQLGGVYRGLGTSCVAGGCPQACCTEYGCVYVDPGSCILDYLGWPQGEGSGCDPDPCEQACCFGNGQCQLLNAASCTAVGGHPMGAGILCTEGRCLRACCLYPEGGCEDRPSDDCLPPNVLKPWNSRCQYTQCPETQACCFGDGRACQDLEPSICTMYGGSPQGEGSVCGATGCQACCFAWGGCTDMLRDLCEYASGLPQGAGTFCASGVCETGACCNYETEQCLLTTWEGCDSIGGVYLGGGTSCDPNPCILPCDPLGDVNQDGLLDGLDIGGFVRAKLGLAPEPGEKQRCADYGGTLEHDMAEFIADLLE